MIDFPVNGTGYNTQARNIGETSNKGIEFQLNGVIVDTKDWGFDINFNISKNKGKVKSLGGLKQSYTFWCPTVYSYIDRG